MFKKILTLAFCFVVVFAIVHSVSAHEVYVLNSNEVAQGLAAPMPDFTGTIQSHLEEFLEWSVCGVLFVMGLFFLSISKPLERALDPILLKIKHYAPAIAQITVGLALLASGWYAALFGPELPFTLIFGTYSFMFQIVFIVMGAMLLLGIFPRMATFILVGIFAYSFFVFHTYMLSYLAYFGEGLIVTIFGSGYALYSFNGLPAFKKNFSSSVQKYKFSILRICFGTSLIYASVYAKLLHGDLALETVMKYHLTNYFHFEPLFLVLGAMLIEIALGLFFLVGFEVRFAALFLLVFLTMSLLFFGEVVWPHLILIGTALALFTHGYDRYTLSAFLQKRTDLEPVI